MSKRITIPLVIAALILTGCSSTAINTAPFKAEAVSVVKPYHKQVNTSIPDGIVKLAKIKKRRELLRVALNGIGVPYVFSGVSKSGWDCSGFTTYVYSKFGVELKHSANKQGHLRKTKHPEIGDIVAFSWDKGRTFDHVGIYAGNGNVINANSYYKRTVVEPLNDFKGMTIVFIRLI
jgi:cell wall-associated NlpC family hydrolase